MAMTLRLSESDTERLRAQAITENRSMQDVAQTAVREYVEQHSLEPLIERALDELTPRYAGALKRLGEM